MSTDWTEYHGIWLCPSLQEGGETRAVTNLQRYFEHSADGEYSFTGGAWDTFDPSGTRASSANVFTADDVLSCTLLSTPIDGQATLQLLNSIEGKVFSRLLPSIPTNIDFVHEAWPDIPGYAAANELFEQLKSLPDVGLTRATKLFARKRPRLVPIVDSVIRHYVFSDGRKHWTPLRDAFRADGLALWRRLERLHGKAELHPQVTTLRVFDVLSWMDATGS